MARRPSRDRAPFEWGRWRSGADWGSGRRSEKRGGIDGARQQIRRESQRKVYIVLGNLID